MIKTLFDLNVLKMAFRFAMDIFRFSRTFPREELYSLTDQVVRSSRSISANIAGGWGKRIYENEFKKHLIYAMGSLEETKVWLLFAKECKYISITAYEGLCKSCDDLAREFIRFSKIGRRFEFRDAPASYL